MAKMGLLDKLTKKNLRSQVEDIVEEQQEATDEDMTGWQAITDTFLRLYPGQTNPRHYGTLIPWQLGGDSPLDGISIYDGGEYYHFVSYGLSELYEKESKDEEYSGYGFELTLKLKKQPWADEEGELRCICGILQDLARLTFKNGEIFLPDEYIYTGQDTGFDAQATSSLTGFLTTLDEAGQIQTPNGSVQFVLLIGATDQELQFIMDKRITVPEMVAQLGHNLTDYGRRSFI